MFCNTEKAWLSQRGIAFTERNIAEDEAALSELEKLEVFSTPATLVDDQVVVGFNACAEPDQRVYRRGCRFHPPGGSVYLGNLSGDRERHLSPASFKNPASSPGE